jgi:hypothetical protein
MFEDMFRLRTLRLSDNNLICDCHLSWLARCFRRARTVSSAARRRRWPRFWTTCQRARLSSEYSDIQYGVRQSLLKLGVKSNPVLATDVLGFVCPGFFVESLTAERKQVRKIHNITFRHLGILLLQNNTKLAKSHVVNFSDLFPFCS